MTGKKIKYKKIPNAFVDRVKRHPWRLCMADDTGDRHNYLSVLATVLYFKNSFLHKAFEPHTRERVGVLFPSSCINALVNLAVQFAGKTPVNLNSKSSAERVQLVAYQCGLKSIITSKAFLKAANIQKTSEMVFLEDFYLDKKSFQKKFFSFLTMLLPGFLIKLCFIERPFSPDTEEATVIYSSGTTGEPKGVILSHRNIASSVNGLRHLLKPISKDCIIGGVPLKQSLGFTACFGLPLTTGMSVLYHSNFLNAESVSKMAQKYRATIFVGIPLLFSAYVRKCTTEDFTSLVCAIAGTERLRKNVTKEFYKKFDVVPFLSYGSAEVSGILTIGVPDYLEEDLLTYRGGKPWRIGHPLPGVAIKIVYPDTFEVVPPGVAGLLLVKSPNVMKGYLINPEMTEKVMREGWYITQDIAQEDEEGRIHILDRHSRVSHIAGEVIPHGEVEEEILDALNASEQVCVVTSVINEHGQEKLVVLYEHNLNVDKLRDKLIKRGNLPLAWIPKEGCFYEIPEIPYLDSGKPDLIKIKERARLMDQVHISGENFVEVTIEAEDHTLIALNHFRRGSDKVVILAHGWRNSKDTYLFKKMSGMFSLDYDVICMDFRGHGRSSGKFMWTAEENKDLRAVVAYARQNEYQKVAVMGFSLGGAVAIIEGSQNRDIDSIIAISPPTEFGRIDFNFWEPEMLNDIRLLIGPKGRGRDVRPGNPFREKIKPIDVIDKVSPTPILFIHGEKDWLIKPYHSEELYKKAKSPKRIVIIKDAGHADKIYDTSSREFEKACYDWLEETL